MDLTKTFTVDQTPEQAFAAINNVRDWWSGAVIEGRTDQLGGEWTYLVEGIHYTKFRTTELVPAKRVVWLTVDSHLSFVEDKEEWTGTTITFDISRVDGRTQVVFTQLGLGPEQECYEICSRAWGEYVTGNLKNLIVTGVAQPDPLEAEKALMTS